MSYQIITDSCCDFTRQGYDRLGLTSVPLTVTFRGSSYPDKNDETLAELYQGLRAGETASTAAVNPQQWQQGMEAILKQGQDVLAICFSSGLSTTYQSAEIAARELAELYPQRKIRVIDSLSASLGQGLLVYHACKKRNAGMELEELANWVEENRLHLCHWFTVDDLMYLKRGGRISAATAVMGTMLSIKPVLHMDDEGHLISMSKVRGRKAAIQALARKVGELSAGYENPVMFISHGDCIEDANTLADLLKTQYGVPQVYINYVGAVIGAHSGPGTLSVFFLGSHR